MNGFRILLKHIKHLNENEFLWVVKTEILLYSVFEK